MGVFSQQLKRKSSSFHSPSNIFTMKIAVCFLAVVSMTLAVPTPQRGGSRVGTRNNGNSNNNKGTNNRIFGGNTGNFLLGAVGGFAGAQLFNNAQGNPCNNLFSGR